MSHKMALKIMSALAISASLFTAPALANNNNSYNNSVKNNKLSADINNYISSLSYNKNSILTRQGESIQNYKPKMGTKNNNEFVVVERIKRNMTQANASVSIMSNTNNVVYPGAILKADSTLVDNNPTLVSIDRAPLALSVDFPGMTNGDSRITIDNPTNSFVREGVNTLVNRWFTKYNRAIPAKMEYQEATAYSMNQLKAKFGADFEKVGAPLKIDFSATASGEKQTHIVNFKQIYYTVSVDAPINPSDLFGKNVSSKDLIQRGINATTPPVYVSNVSYGRNMYVKFETTSKTKEFKEAIEAAIKGVTLNQGSEYSNVLKNTSVSAVILGGNSQGAASVVTGTVDDFKRLISEGSTFSENSPALPISYTTHFLKDNQQAIITNHTDYIETKVTSYKNSYLNLEHKGAYIARYYVNWEEVNYDENGNETIRSRSWELNGRGLTSGFSASIELKGNVRNLRVKVQECTGLAWEWWRTIYDKTELPLVQKRTISHWGTTLRPKVAESIQND